MLKRNRLFFPQSILDQWVEDEEVDFHEDVVHVKNEKKSYRIIEGFRVLAEAANTSDRYELVGRVKSKAYLLELGAELMDRSMLLEETVYDVVSGFIATPIDEQISMAMNAIDQTEVDDLAALLESKMQ